MRETVWRRGREVVFRGVYIDGTEPPQPPPHYETTGLTVTDREYKLPRRRCPLCRKYADAGLPGRFMFEVDGRVYQAHFACVVDVLAEAMHR